MMKRFLIALSILLLLPHATFAATTFQGSAVESAADNPHTFSSMAIGTAAADRYVIVTFVNDGAAVITGATIGGVAATVAYQHLFGASVTNGVIIANVPTGTTADVVITWDVAAAGAGIGVYTDNGVNTTPFDTDFINTSGTGAVTVNIDTPASGILFGIAGHYNDGPSSYTWTGPTEDYDAAFRSDARSSGAHNSPGAQSGYTVTATPSGGNGHQLAAVSFAYTAAAVSPPSLPKYYPVNWW